MNDPNSPQYSASSSQPSELRSNSVSPSSRFMSAPGRPRMGSGSDCPYPVNFRQVKGEAREDGSLYFEYKWDSSTGNKDDLAGCAVGEIVLYPGGNPDESLPPTYYRPSNPPFNKGYINPTVLETPGNVVSGEDHHYAPDFSLPYCEASFSADQTYRYHTPCMPSIYDYETLMGPHTIVRKVYQENGTWKYSCEKKGIKSVLTLPGQTIYQSNDNLQEAIENLRKIQVGATRKTLLELFRPAEGFSTPFEGTFQYRACHRIFVHAQFQVEANTQGEVGFGDNDKIVRLSKPYLDTL